MIRSRRIAGLLIGGGRWRGWKRDLFGALQVSDKIDNLPLLKGVKKPFGHHRKIGLVPRHDFVPWQSNCSGLSLDSNSTFVFVHYHSGDEAVIFGFEVGRLVAVPNNGVWIEHVFQEVIKI